MDPITVIGAVGGGVAILQGAAQGLGFLKGIANSDVISGYFRWDGERIHGDERLIVQRHNSDSNGDVWYYSVNQLDGYEFSRLPVGADAAIEIFGQEVGQNNPDPRFWRWIAPTLPGRIYGGGEPPNAKVNFVVVGYKAAALAEYFSKARGKHA